MVVADEDEIERVVFEPSDWSKPRALVLACGPRRFHERGAAAVGSGNRPPAALSCGLGIGLGLGLGLGWVGSVTCVSSGSLDEPSANIG